MSGSERTITVLDAGMLSTVQDLGRNGRGDSGVSPSGAVDWYSARAANRLVGNADGLAVIETTLSGVALVADGRVRVAVTGAEADLTIDGVRRSCWKTHDVERAQRIVVGAARMGVRSYVAFAGGVDVDEVLGSRSTDVGAGIGGRALVAGDRLAVGAPPTEVQRLAALAYAPGARWDFGSPAVLRAMRGQDAEALGSALLDALVEREYRGSVRSGRQALRLDGTPIPTLGAMDRTSAGVCAGCVQVTGDGLPLVLLAEHQTTGGYPVAMCVVTADVARAAQVRPGDPVRFAMVGAREAARALETAFSRLDAFGPAPAEDDGDPFRRLSRGFFEGA